MADCKDIDAALSRLSSKIDGLGNRLNDLDTKQKECCDKKEKQAKDVDLEPLIKRINKLETSMDLVTKYLKDGLGPLVKLFNTAIDYFLF